MKQHGKFRWTSATFTVLASAAAARASRSARAAPYTPQMSANAMSVSRLRQRASAAASWLRPIRARTDAITRSAMPATVPFTSTTAALSRYTPPSAAGPPKPEFAATTPSWFHAKPPRKRERMSSSPHHSTGSANRTPASRRAQPPSRAQRQYRAESQP